jgi:VirE N-terminal domain/Primase C terminal 2 (PriCT-2)
LEKILISKYNRVYDNESVSVALSEEFKTIKYGSYKQLVELARKHYLVDKTTYSKYKKQLPAVTFSGVFGAQRKMDFLTVYVPSIIFDIDHLDEDQLPIIKMRLGQDKYVLAVWLSPSGCGLKFLIQTNNTEASQHKYYFDAAVQYFQKQYGVVIDVSGSDPTRLCFSSYDPDIIITDNHCLFTDSIIPANKEDKIQRKLPEDKLSIISNQNRIKNKKADKDLLGRITRFLRRKQASITSNYDSWFKVALAIANTFTYDAGERFFLDLCRLDKEGHDEEKSISILQYAYRNRYLNVVTIGTIVYLAEQKGFVLRKLNDPEK